MNIETSHGKLIDQLNGGRQLTKRLNALTGSKLSEKAVYAWKNQGIPDKWRIAVSRCAIQDGLDIPFNFLPPGINLQDIPSADEPIRKNIRLIRKNKIINTTKKVDNSEMLILYKEMLQVRRFEEKIGQMYGMGLIGGFCHLYIGQEAVVVGLEHAIKPTDSVITAYRCHAHMIVRGSKPLEVIAELLGKESGVSKGKGGSMHMFDPINNFYGGHGIVGAQVPIGTGLAFAHSYREDNGIAVVYFGDGAANQGQVYEAFNMAALWKLPVLYIIENNQYGMGTSVKKASAVSDLFRHGESFGIPGMQIDGMDPIAVRDAGIKAAEDVRSLQGPLILEMLTYRYRGHSMSDPGKYRSREEIQRTREERDPIERIKSYLILNNVATQEELTRIDSKIRNNINDAAEEAKLLPDASPKQLLKNIYVEKSND